MRDLWDACCAPSCPEHTEHRSAAAGIWRRHCWHVKGLLTPLHVSLQVIQFARHHGFKTINLVRRREQVQEIKDAGYVLAQCHPTPFLALKC